jgi:hypothetical protein
MIQLSFRQYGTFHVYCYVGEILSILSIISVHLPSSSLHFFIQSIKHYKDHNVDMAASMHDNGLIK